MIAYFAQLFRIIMIKCCRILLLAFLTLFLNSCALFHSVEVGEVQGINFEKFGNQKVTFELLIPIENKNLLNFRIREVNLDVIVNNEYLGKITNVDDILIFQKSNQIYSFPLDIEYTGTNILRGALTLFSLFLERKADVRISGFIRVRSFLFSKKIEVDERSIVLLNPKE